MSKTKTFIVSDTITFKRTWRVKAPSENVAIELVENGSWTGNPVALLDEEQIDNAPYEVEEEEA